MLVFILSSYKVFSEEAKVVIKFFPMKQNKSELVIYNDGDIDYSKKIIKSINSSIPRFFYSSKDELSYGWFVIEIYQDNVVKKYEVFNKDVIYDVNKKRILSCKILEQIYEYIAVKELREY